MAIPATATTRLMDCGESAVLLGGGVGIAATGLLWAGIPSLRRFGAPTAVEPGSFASPATNPRA